ncbi:non-intrinsic ABC protein 10, partial [Striga asiatica]
MADEPLPSHRFRFRPLSFIFRFIQMLYLYARPIDFGLKMTVDQLYLTNCRLMASIAVFEMLDLLLNYICFSSSVCFRFPVVDRMLWHNKIENLSSFVIPTLGGRGRLRQKSRLQLAKHHRTHSNWDIKWASAYLFVLFSPRIIVLTLSCYPESKHMYGGSVRLFTQAWVFFKLPNFLKVAIDVHGDHEEIGVKLDRLQQIEATEVAVFLWSFPWCIENQKSFSGVPSSPVSASPCSSIGLHMEIVEFFCGATFAIL